MESLVQLTVESFGAATPRIEIGLRPYDIVKSQFVELFTKLVKTLASPMGEVPRMGRRGQ